MSDEPHLLDTVGVAALLSVHPKHVFRLLKRGLPGHRLGGEWRFERERVLEWVRNQATDAKTGALEPPPLLAANGDVCVEVLLGLLGDVNVPLGFVQSDAGQGRQLLERGHVLAAGVHGDAPVASGPTVTLHVTRRSIGVAYAKGKRVRALRDLAKLRLASRPITAGVRKHLTRALEHDGLDAEKLHEKALICGSHRDVALALLSGQADAGVLTVAWAERAALGWLPIADEDYGLCLRAEALGSERGRELLRALQSRELRRALTATAGYDARDAGAVRA